MTSWMMLEWLPLLIRILIVILGFFGQLLQRLRFFHRPLMLMMLSLPVNRPEYLKD